MNVKTISHLAFQVRDMEAMLHFYRDQLGFKQICDTTYDLALARVRKQIPTAEGPALEGLKGVERNFAAKEGQPWFVYLRINDSQLLELFYPDEEYLAQAAGPGRYRHLSLEVDDIQKAHQDLVDAGVTIHSGPYTGADGTWTMWIADPEGNEIEIMEYTANSLQLLGRETE